MIRKYNIFRNPENTDWNNADYSNSLVELVDEWVKYNFEDTPTKYEYDSDTLNQIMSIKTEYAEFWFYRYDNETKGTTDIYMKVWMHKNYTEPVALKVFRFDLEVQE